MAVGVRNNQSLFNANSSAMQTTNVINNTYTINMTTQGTGDMNMGNHNQNAMNQKGNAGKGKGAKGEKDGKGDKGDKKGKGKGKL